MAIEEDTSEDGPGEKKFPTPSQGLARLLRLLGVLGVFAGFFIALLMALWDELNGRKASAMGTLQILGMVTGICAMLFGIFFYVWGTLGDIERRQLRILQEIASRPAAAPATPAPARREEPLSRAPERAHPPVAPSVPEDAHNQEPQTPVPETAKAPLPVPEDVTPEPETPQTAPEQATIAQETAAPEMHTEPAARASPEPDPAYPLAPETPQPAPEQPAYDYSTAPRPQSRSCTVCGNELDDGKCPHCLMSAKIEEAYYDVSKIQSSGANVDEAASLLQSARQSLDEKNYDEAAEFVRGSLNLANESSRKFTQLTKSFSDAEEAKLQLENDGRDTIALAKLLARARSALESGTYNDVKEQLETIEKTISEYKKPPPQPAPSPAPETPKHQISNCPKCGKKVMGGWKKCPYCLTPIV